MRRILWIALPIVAVLAVVVWQSSDSNDDPAAQATTPPPKPKVHCTRTVPSGLDISTAIVRARGGATICLEAGTYPPLSLTELSKSPAVTIRSGNDGRATLGGLELADVSGLSFAALNLSDGASVVPSGSNLRFVGNDITGSHGIYLFGDYRIDDRITDVWIKNNTIHDIDYSGDQGPGEGYGIIGVGEVRHMVISGNTIQSPASDYIQSASPVNWVVDHNTFLGPSLLADHEDHQDLWQIFGGGENIAFTNNVARDTETQESLLFQTGHFSNVKVENNLFDHDSRGYTCQIYQADGLVFRRNTVVGSRWGCFFRDLASAPPGRGYVVKHNIFVNTHEGLDVSTEGRAARWGVYDFNVSSDGSANGRHSERRWSPRWVRNSEFAPLGLPFAAGYEAP